MFPLSDDEICAFRELVRERLGGGPHWGSSVRVMSPRRPNAQEDPENQSNWGRQDTVNVGDDPAQHTFINLTLLESQAITVYSQVPTPATTTTLDLNGNSIDVFLWAQAEVGNGSASYRRKWRIDGDFVGVVLSGQYVRVWAYFGDKIGTAIPLSKLSPTVITSPPFAVVALFASRSGSRGVPYLVTKRTNNAGATSTGSTLVAASAELISIHAHIVDAAGAAPLFLQLFDTSTGVPINGTSPIDEFALSTPGPGSELAYGFDNPVPYRSGVTYAISTTSGTLTLAGKAAFVTVETLEM